MVRLVVYDILNKSDKVSEVLGDKLYHLFVPEDTTGIALFYKLSGSDVETGFGKHTSYKESEITFYVSGEDDMEIIKFLKDLRYVLEEEKGSEHAGCVLKKAKFITEDENVYEDGYYEMSMIFSFGVDEQ